MAVAQKAISRDVSEREIPIFDLNHCRSSSTSEIRAIGVLQMKEARRTRSSKARTGSVSRIAYWWRAATRAASLFTGLRAAIVGHPRLSAALVLEQQPMSLRAYTKAQRFERCS